MRDKEVGDSGEKDFGEGLQHELNNPLTGILGNAELLLSDQRRRTWNCRSSRKHASRRLRTWPFACERSYGA